VSGPPVHPLTLNRADRATSPRTLVDVLRETVRRHPDSPAMDDGNRTLTYQRLSAEVDTLADRLRRAGIGRGDRVGVRMASGTIELYVSILAVVTVGAAYVPADLDDPPERASLVFSEAAVKAVLTAVGGIELTGRAAEDSTATMKAAAGRRSEPTPDDDAWIIFTSGSTGTPKGVAVTHRCAAAFVDAEARLFAQDTPLGPGDRVLAGLSVAFDASCEEMWLAWRHGACLVPAPRALVRSGVDLAPWLVAQGITVVSTVPTLASLWPAESLGAIRLLIFGGEACPPELAARLAVPKREVWNTYGPTEATVVSCAAQLTGTGPVRIGLPLDGWDLAVVGLDGQPVAEGEVGELIIGGVGLARYLDPAKDAEKYAPMPALGWERAYRSGDLVRYDPAGLLFVGRADDQVKIGGRRIELGEIDNALLALPGVVAAAAAVRATRGRHQIIVGYLALEPSAVLDLADATRRLRETLPAALVPRLAIVEAIPTRTSGKADRDALPWPLPELQPAADASPALTGTAGWVAEQWSTILGAGVGGMDDDFFVQGGGSLAAAQLVSLLRAKFPEVTVADVYENARLGDLVQTLEEFAPPVSAAHRTVLRTPRRAQAVQLILAVPLATVTGLRWLTWLAILDQILRAAGGFSWAPTVAWGWALAGWLLLITPPGRLALAAAGARIALRGVRPGRHPRGGPTHLRLWFSEGWAAVAGAENLSCAPWMASYARLLGAKIGRNVDLHAVPPVTGLLTLGDGCSVEPEVDLLGHWLDGDVLHLGRVRIGAGATVGSRSVLAPGTRIGQDVEIAAGSAVSGPVPPGEFWAGSPAVFSGFTRFDRLARRPPTSPAWTAAYGLTAVLLATFPLIAVGLGIAVVVAAGRGRPSLGAAVTAGAAWVPAGTLVALATYALLVLISVRLLGLGLREGYHPVHSRIGWQVWATERLMDEARDLLFPLYASLATPAWLRALGAKVGRGVEASTVLLLPRMTTVGDDAFLADDTLVGSYELGGGWMRIEPAIVGKRAFLGNSGMTAPGRRVPKDGLVAVLSAAPARAKVGTSWIGSPPVQLRRAPTRVDRSRTFAPPRRLKVARGIVEAFRLVPVTGTLALLLGVLFALAAVAERLGWWAAAAASGIIVLAAGVVAAGVTTVAKWLLVGRIRATEHPLWSWFVWCNEVADTFVEMLAAPWFARPATGTVALNLWLRSLGAKIGAGVWCESYWLPEADLVRVGVGSSVNRGCVLQTHLFHDRIMSLDTVRLDAGATLGPHGVILPAAAIGTAATVGPSSLVMRGEAVPPQSRWTGNPIAPWPGATDISR
jgi:non-ribosomal peptide synthetase-like protein